MGLESVPLATLKSPVSRPSTRLVEGDGDGGGFTDAQGAVIRLMLVAAEVHAVHHQGLVGPQRAGCARSGQREERGLIAGILDGATIEAQGGAGEVSRSAELSPA